MRHVSSLVLAASFVVCLGACNRSAKQVEKEKVQAKSLPKATFDPTQTASIAGVVKFSGTAPLPQTIDMSVDPGCRPKDTRANPIAVADGKLANAFVYIKAGLPEVKWDFPDRPVYISQDGCRYHPHIAAAMTGQRIVIENRDITTHNVHPMPKADGNREWNESQAPNADPIMRTFNHQEIMIPVKCNQHPWMKMYLNVMSHPFFAVTGSDGKFEIKGLPPGTYTLAVVQEKLGEQEQQITVGPKEDKTVDFSYSPASGQ